MDDARGSARWVPVGPAEGIAPGTLHTFKEGRRQLVVGRTEDGRAFALDNRCPHEGYPLTQGRLKEGTLTCCWHNWKFAVADGACLIGGEAVRAYPVREREGRLEVDLAEPDPASLLPRLRASVERALFDHDLGRGLRDGVRLLEAGHDPARFLAELAGYDARHAEYGSTHVVALAADCTRLLGRYRGAEAMYAIAPVLDLCGETNRRLQPRPRPEPERVPTEDLAACLVEAIEAEELERAQALVHGAYTAGPGRAPVEGALRAAVARHFTDFGHPLIYLVKAGELFDRAGDEHASDVHAALAAALVHATREDELPYWRGHRERLAEVAPELEALAARARPSARFEGREVVDAVLDGSPAEAFGALHGALVSGVPAEPLARVLVAAAAERLWRFDAALDASPAVAEGWLWATHRLTYAAAVHRVASVAGDADALRLLFHAVAFLHTGRRMDAAAHARPRVEPAQGTIAEIASAVRGGSVERALALALGWVRAGRPLAELEAALLEHVLRGPYVRPIFTTHGIKTTVAAFEEARAMEDAHAREVLVLAAVRFLASPVVERAVHDSVTTALRWVRDGEMPAKLTQ